MNEGKIRVEILLSRRSLIPSSKGRPSPLGQGGPIVHILIKIYFYLFILSVLLWYKGWFLNLRWASAHRPPWPPYSSATAKFKKYTKGKDEKALVHEECMSNNSDNENGDGEDVGGARTSYRYNFLLHLAVWPPPPQREQDYYYRCLMTKDVKILPIHNPPLFIPNSSTSSYVSCDEKLEDECQEEGKNNVNSSLTFMEDFLRILSTLWKALYFQWVIDIGNHSGGPIFMNLMCIWGSTPGK